MQPNGTINARCSCNGKRPCIHIKALLYACQSIFSNLDETVKIYDKLDGLKDKLLSKNPEPLSCLFDKNFRLSDCLKINEALKDLPSYKQIKDVVIMEKEFEKTTSNKIKRQKYVN